MKRRFFFLPSGEVYGAASGLFDLGPYGTALKWKLLDAWKKEFIEYDDHILPLETASVMQEKSLIASGHVEKFQDLLVRDTVTGDVLRVDHMIQEHLEKTLSEAESAARWSEMQPIIYGPDPAAGTWRLLEELKLTHHPQTGHPLSQPFEFNLMFSTRMGAEGKRNAYLRPELAQGIFLNFGHVFRQTDGSLPFGVASIGNVYRNEVSARQGLLRTREFTLAEIEFFFHPDHTDHTTDDFWERDGHTELPILTAEKQAHSMQVELRSIERLRDEGTVKQGILLYYMHKTMRFLLDSGIKPSCIRFRQHLPDEMAHYASDCWDVEIYSLQYGWIECVGIANRTDYDLKRHGQWSGRENQLSAFVPFPNGQTRTERVCQVKPKQPLFGKTFKKQASALLSHLNEASLKQMEAFRQQMEAQGQQTVTLPDGTEHVVPQDAIEFIESDVTRTGTHVVPHVIEPSFGINRILYCILEHNYYVRAADQDRTFLTLPVHLAPITCEVVVMKKNESSMRIMDDIIGDLRGIGVTCHKDTKSRSIGRRYSIIDEIGTPFIITIDERSTQEFETDPNTTTVTIRDRNSMTQVRDATRILPKIFQRLKRGCNLFDVCPKE